ncbi:Uncharacterized protein pbN1_27270 [Aromatoleum bremense]|nr:Uncharacterized protein pbN1_27270 [Aromatoleum bremense]
MRRRTLRGPPGRDSSGPLRHDARRHTTQRSSGDDTISAP